MIIIYNYARLRGDFESACLPARIEPSPRPGGYPMIPESTAMELNPCVPDALETEDWLAGIGVDARCGRTGNARRPLTLIFVSLLTHREIAVRLQSPPRRHPRADGKRSSIFRFSPESHMAR